MAFILGGLWDFFQPPVTPTDIGNSTGNVTSSSPEEFPKHNYWLHTLLFATWTMGVMLLLNIIGYLVKNKFPIIFGTLANSLMGHVPIFGKIFRKISRLGNSINLLSHFHDELGDRIELVNSKVEDVGQESATLFLDVYEKLSSSGHMSQFAPRLAQVESQCSETHRVMRHELRDLSTRVSDMGDQLTPPPDHILTEILGDQFPIYRPANGSIQDYIDKKLKNFPRIISHHIKHLASQHDVSQLSHEFTTTLDLIRHDFQDQIKNLKNELQKVKESHNAHTPPPTTNPIPHSIQVSPIQQEKDFHQSTAIQVSIPEKSQVRFAGSPESHIASIPQPYGPDITTTSNTVVFHSGGSIPVPKFVPHLETPENFLKEAELYMKRKRIMEEDWLLMLPSIFKDDKNQTLWWQSTKLMVSTWEDFKKEFIMMYGSATTKHQSLERLLNRRQKPHESFQNFALEMNMIYRKIFALEPSTKMDQVLQFIAERALPHLKAPLISCRAENLVELINYGKIFESSAKQVEESKPKYFSQAAKTQDTPTPKNTHPKVNEDKEENKSASPPRSKPTRVCSFCPGKTSHDTAYCFKNKSTPARVNIAQVEAPKQVPHSENGKRE